MDGGRRRRHLSRRRRAWRGPLPRHRRLRHRPHPRDRGERQHRHLGARRHRGDLARAAIGSVNVIGTADHQTLDFSNVAFSGIGVVDALGGNDTISTSDLTDGQAYRGGAGNDSFVLGSADTRPARLRGRQRRVRQLLAATPRAPTTGSSPRTPAPRSASARSTPNDVDTIDGSGKANVTVVGSSGSHDVWDLTDTELLGIAEVATGGRQRPDPHLEPQRRRRRAGLSRRHRQRQLLLRDAGHPPALRVGGQWRLRFVQRQRAGHAHDRRRGRRHADRHRRASTGARTASTSSTATATRTWPSSAAARCTTSGTSRAPR